MALRTLLQVATIAATCLAAAWAQSCGGKCQTNFQCSTNQFCSYCMATTTGKICGAGCAQSCGANSDCKDINCPYCNGGKCGPKDACGGPCSTGMDCPSGCSQCTDGKCNAGHDTCGSSCAVNSECATSHGDCQHCLKFNGNPMGKCGVGCHGNCTMDSNCLDPNCKYCSQGACYHTRKGRTCAQSCVLDSDCTGSSNCFSCVREAGKQEGKCLAVCEGPCTSNADCQKGCGNCKMGKCQA